jgi:hypothetical protein
MNLIKYVIYKAVNYKSINADEISSYQAGLYSSNTRFVLLNTSLNDRCLPAILIKISITLLS